VDIISGERGNVLEGMGEKYFLEKKGMLWRK